MFMIIVLIAMLSASLSASSSFVHPTLRWNLSITHDPVGETLGDHFGKAVAVSGDGTRMVVASPEWANEKGKIYVYRRDNATSTEWIHVPAQGNGRMAGAAGEKFGNRVAISPSGKYVAGTSLDVTLSEHRTLRLFTANVQNDVYQGLGNDFGEMDLNEYFNSSTPSSQFDGTSVAFAEFDNIVAVGCIGHYSSELDLRVGGVAVLHFDASGNVTEGWTIEGDSGSFIFGSKVDLSGDGHVLVVSDPFRFNSRTSPVPSGQVLVFAQETDGTWSQLGQNLTGDLGSQPSPYSLGCGLSVSLSQDGDVLAVGYVLTT